MKIFILGRGVCVLVHHSVSIKVFLILLAGVEDKVGILVAGLVIDKLHEADVFAILSLLTCHLKTSDDCPLFQPTTSSYPRAFVFFVLNPVSIYIIVAGISLAVVVEVSLVLIEDFWTVVADISEAVVVRVLLVLVLLVRAIVAAVATIHVVNMISVNVQVATADDKLGQKTRLL